MTRCAHCGAEIEPGRGREIQVDQATGASPDLVLHADPRECKPVPYVRRTV